MIDPNNPPTVEKSYAELEEFIVFSVAVAGKNSSRTARSVHLLKTILDAILDNEHRDSPFLQSIYYFLAMHGYASSEPASPASKQALQALASKIKLAGMGCYTRLARSFAELAVAVYEKGMNLKSVSVEELKKIHGIGNKTARFFVVYTKPGTTRYAILDVHILRWMKDLGYNCPSSTPTSDKAYENFEEEFCYEAGRRGLTPRQLDTAIWQSRRQI